MDGEDGICSVRVPWRGVSSPCAALSGRYTRSVPDGAAPGEHVSGRRLPGPRGRARRELSLHPLVGRQLQV